MSANKEQGIALYNVKKFDLAEVAFRKALVEDPNDPGTHALLANALIAQKKYDKGAMEARLTIKCAPDLANGYIALTIFLAAGPVFLITGIVTTIIATSEPDKKPEPATPKTTLTRPSGSGN